MSFQEVTLLNVTSHIAVLTNTTSNLALMPTYGINWPASGPLLPQVLSGVWFKNPLINPVKTNYNLSLHVELSPECYLIIGLDKRPGQTRF